MVIALYTTYTHYGLRINNIFELIKIFCTCSLVVFLPFSYVRKWLIQNCAHTHTHSIRKIHQLYFCAWNIYPASSCHDKRSPPYFLCIWCDRCDLDAHLCCILLKCLLLYKLAQTKSSVNSFSSYKNLFASLEFKRKRVRK